MRAHKRPKLERPPQQRWTAERVLQLASRYRECCVLAAAADLDLFAALQSSDSSGPELARRLRVNERAITILLDAMAAIHLLEKSGARYRVRPDVAAVLTPMAEASVLAMTQHHANCLRRWAQLAQVVKTGRPALRRPSIRGKRKDAAAFIGGMHDLNVRLAPQLVGKLQPLRFKCLLDVGGASGTWTIAFLRANPAGRAILFDLPHVIPLARRRLRAAGMDPRVNLVAGDFTRDELPSGADLAWVSAIVHQNSRVENRALFKKIARALRPGGKIAIRDVVMEPARTAPVPGALFAVNMLVSTRGGGTFTFDELRDDLASAGFTRPRLLRRGQGNDSVVMATLGNPAPSLSPSAA